MTEKENTDTEEVVLTEQTLENDLTKQLQGDGPLKQMFVDYVGTKLNLDPEKDQVTLEMAINTMADEFPEFILAIAEENFVRGYKQALHDVDFIRKQQESEPNLLSPDVLVLEDEVKE